MKVAKDCLSKKKKKKLKMKLLPPISKMYVLCSQNNKNNLVPAEEMTDINGTE